MLLCLLVYTMAQRQVQAALFQSKSTVENQFIYLTEQPDFR